MSRGQALPLDASEIYDSLSAAETYASTSAIAYEGQTVKAKTADGKYHEYILQPSESGYILEEVGALKASDLKQYVQLVEDLPESGQEAGVLYLVNGIEDDLIGGGHEGRHFGDLFHGFSGHDCAGGIIGRVDHQDLGLVGDQGFDHFRLHFKVFFRLGGNADSFTVAVFYLSHIVQPLGVLDEDFVSIL